ncbi:hypothetical protein F5887DRAFT_997617, partial [Amanita rubescens]
MALHNRYGGLFILFLTAHHASYSLAKLFSSEYNEVESASQVGNSRSTIASSSYRVHHVSHSLAKLFSPECNETNRIHLISLSGRLESGFGIPRNLYNRSDPIISIGMAVHDRSFVSFNQESRPCYFAVYGSRFQNLPDTL